MLEVVHSGVLTGKVFDITADSATTGTGINMSMDGLTTGSALAIDSDSSDTGVRSIASVIQNHASATGATALYVQNDSTGAGVEIRGGVQTGADAAGVLKLSTAHTSMVDAVQLGRIDFQDP